MPDNLYGQIIPDKVFAAGTQPSSSSRGAASPNLPASMLVDPMARLKELVSY